jgi:hypothetical protein
MLRPGHHRRRSSAAAKAASNEQRTHRQSNADPSMEEDSKEVESTQKDPSTQATNQKDTDMDDIADSMAALKFVPPSVKFGRGRGRGGFARS